MDKLAAIRTDKQQWLYNTLRRTGVQQVTLTSNILLNTKKEACHNRLRNITASLLKEVHHNICIEPMFQKLTGEWFEQRAASNMLEGVRLESAANGFGVAGQIELFSISVFYSDSTRYAN